MFWVASAAHDATTGTATASTTGPGHLQVVAVLGPVGVHTREHDLASPQPFDLARPRNRLAARSHAAASDMDFPDFPAFARALVWDRC